MQKKIVLFLKSFFISAFVGTALFGISYYSLKPNESPVKQNMSNISYYDYTPESVGLSVEISSEKTFLFLDFYNKSINIIYDFEKMDSDGSTLGYTVDYYIKGDYEFLAKLVDLIGGIELEENGETFRYTGVQVADMLQISASYDDLERIVIRKILKKIKTTGLTKEDFLYIIENSETSLSVPICYNWPQYVKELCSFINEVN